MGIVLNFVIHIAFPLSERERANFWPLGELMSAKDFSDGYSWLDYKMVSKFVQVSKWHVCNKCKN